MANHNSQQGPLQVKHKAESKETKSAILLLSNNLDPNAVSEPRRTYQPLLGRCYHTSAMQFPALSPGLVVKNKASK